MEWIIELEKGLRSKWPGQPIKVIEQIGPKLHTWGREPCITMAVSNMYGLLPGEEKTFANTILLRVADAFRSGDNRMRAFILKVFLLELRNLKKKGRRHGGILTKPRLPNYLELLKKVKIVFDTGDIKAKALSLRLFGSWAHLTHDSADVRYMILSSLQSCHNLEIKASLFAAGCLCELSEDFACIMLGVLIDIICSSKASSGVKLSATRALAKMQCSSLVASSAYKAGKKLVLDSLLEDYMVEMLFTLSKLAVRSILFISEQADFLLSFLTREYASAVKSMALKCMCFLSLGGASHFPVNGNVLTTLFHKINNTDLSFDLQCETLRLLHQIFSFNLLNVPYMDMPEFYKLVLIVESVSQSPIVSKRYLALGLLVNISCNLKKARKGDWSCPEQWSVACVSPQLDPLNRPQIDGIGLLDLESSQALALVSDGNGPSLLAYRVILLLINQITSLAKSVNIKTAGEPIFMEDARFCAAAPEFKQECHILFNHIVRLIEVYPALGLMVLKNIRCLIEDLVNMHFSFNSEASGKSVEVSQMEMDFEKPIPVCEFLESDREKHTSVVSEIILCICRFTGACLNILEETGAVTSEVYSMAKLLVERIQKSGYCNSDTCEIFPLRLHSYIMWHCCGMKNNIAQGAGESKVGADSSLSDDDCWVDHEWLSLEFAKRMMTRRKYWTAYRTGKYSACEGLWFAATFTFRKLIDMVQSDSHRYWLRSLMLLAGAESELKLHLFPKLGIQLINGLRTDNNCGNPCVGVGETTGQCVGGITELHDYIEKLSRIHKRICSSQEILAVAGTSNGAFCFQWWFLSLRVKILEILMDVLGLLKSHAYCEENLDSCESVEQNLGIRFTVLAEHTHNLSFHFTCISFRLNKLAKEYDLLAKSFMDIDCKSSISISRFALNCSLLAFCTAFPLYFSNSYAYENIITHSLGILGNSSGSVLVKDLAERLCDIDSKSTMDLERYMTVSGELRGCLHYRMPISRSDHTDRATILISRLAIPRFLRLHEEAKGAKDKEDICRVFREGLQLLFDILKKWMGIPFQTPKFFFRTRPCITAELFVFNADVRNQNELSVLPGNQLSLNLCIQLRNVSPECHARVARMYCILAARPSEPLSGRSHEGERQVKSGFQGWKAEEMVDLNEMLQVYINHNPKNTNVTRDVHADGGELATTCVCFDLNEQGQGFSTCLLDVSAFPEGAYQIKWHSCCIDNSGSYWSLLPLNTALFFSVNKPSVAVSLFSEVS